MGRNRTEELEMIRAGVAAPVLVVAAFLTGAATVVGLVLLVAAVVMLATAATGFCPLYRLFGIDTSSRVRTH